MKYTIEGFDQETAVELGLSSDDLIVLRWFVDFYGTHRMVKVIINTCEYAWINYKSLLEDLPILKISKQTLSKRIFGNLVKSGVLKKEVIKKASGTFTVFTFGESYEPLLTNNPRVNNQTHTLKNTDATSRNLPVGTSKKIPMPPVEIYQPKDPNTKDPNTKDPNTKDIVNKQIDSIWRLYPKKMGKGKATKKIEKLIKQHGYDQVVRCIDRYKQEIELKRISEQYIQYGSTFFNGGYMDYLDENYNLNADKTSRVCYLEE